MVDDEEMLELVDLQSIGLQLTKRHLQILEQHLKTYLKRRNKLQKITKDRYNFVYRFFYAGLYGLTILIFFPDSFAIRQIKRKQSLFNFVV